MIPEYIKLTSKRKNVGSDEFKPLWYARMVGVNETLTDAHETPFHAVNSLLDSIDLNEIDWENGLEIEYFEFLEHAAPRLVMNHAYFHRDGKAKSYETGKYIQDLISAIIDPIRKESDYMPWTTHNLHRLTIRSVVAAKEHFRDANSFDYVVMGIVMHSDGDVIKMSMIDKAEAEHV